MSAVATETRRELAPEPLARRPRRRWTRFILPSYVAAFILYLWRHLVQDKIPVKLREEVPLTPEDELRHPEFRVAPDAVTSA